MKVYRREIMLKRLKKLPQNIVFLYRTKPFLDETPLKTMYFLKIYIFL